MTFHGNIPAVPWEWGIRHREPVGWGNQKREVTVLLDGYLP